MNFGEPIPALSFMTPLLERNWRLRLVNTYHLFASITRERIEPEFQTLAAGPVEEREADDAAWTAQHLRHKPGDVTRAPDFVAPHQPRVDFRLWFYGLAFQRRPPAYVSTLLERLCEEPAGRAAAVSRATAAAPGCRPPRVLAVSVHQPRREARHRRLVATDTPRDHARATLPPSSLTVPDQPSPMTAPPPTEAPVPATAPTGRARTASIGTLFLTVFIDLLGFGLVIPFLPGLARRLGAGDFVATMPGAVYSVMQFLFIPIWGRLSDRVGRRPVLLWSIAATAVGMALVGLAPSLLLLLAARAFSGIATANIAVAQAYVADVTPPEHRARGMGDHRHRLRPRLHLRSVHRRRAGAIPGVRPGRRSCPPSSPPGWRP